MYNSPYLQHYGKPGMKWGYNDGVRNGKAVAEWDRLDPKQQAILLRNNPRAAQKLVRKSKARNPFRMGMNQRQVKAYSENEERC